MIYAKYPKLRTIQRLIHILIVLPAKPQVDTFAPPEIRQTHISQIEQIELIISVWFYANEFWEDKDRNDRDAKTKKI